MRQTQQKKGKSLSGEKMRITEKKRYKKGGFEFWFWIKSDLEKQEDVPK